MNDIDDALRRIVGSAHVLTDDDVVRSYACDLTGRYSGTATAVVRPGSPAEVSAVIRACNERGQPVVPQGGNTGLVGGQVPRAGEVVVSLGRLDRLDAVDPAAAQVTAEAGVTLAALQHHVRAAGYDFGVDLAARETATVGGMIATNAGGARALRYGTMRAQVVGLEAVLASGNVIGRLDGLVKDNAGFDLASLVIGAEGALAVITRARLRLIQLVDRRLVALLGFDSLDAAVAWFTQARTQLSVLEAADFFMATGLELTVQLRRLPRPLPSSHPVYVIAELAGEGELDEALAEATGSLAPTDIAVGTSPSERARLWEYREAQSEVATSAGVHHSVDVGVPIAALPSFCAAVTERVHEIDAGALCVLYGHLGDGNVHVSAVGPSAEDYTVDEAILQLAAEAGGTISAEHGIGVQKARWLHLCREPGEIDAMQRLKAAFDPNAILNRGRVLPH